MKSYIQIESHFDHPDRSKRFGFSLVFDIVHVVEKGLGFIKPDSLNGAGSLIPRCSGFFSGCSDLWSFGASRLVSSSRPFALRASGWGYLAFFRHVTWLSAIETWKFLLVAIRGSGSSFAFGECINFCFAIFICEGIQHTDIHSVRVSVSGGRPCDSEESGQLSLLTNVSYLGQVISTQIRLSMWITCR